MGGDIVKNARLKKLLPYIIFILSLVSTLMLFAPVLTYQNLTFSGANIAFGRTIYSLDIFGIEAIARGELPMNMYAIAAFFAPLIGGLFTIVFKKGQVFSLAMFVVAAAMFFMMNEYVVIEYTIANQTLEQNVDWQNAYGLIIAGFASILAAIGEMLHISMTEQT